MTEIEDDPKALLEFLSQSPGGQEVLRTTGGLHALLFQMAAQSPSSDAQRRALDQVVQSAVSVHFKTWRVDPELQREMTSIRRARRRPPTRPASSRAWRT